MIRRNWRIKEKIARYSEAIILHRQLVCQSASTFHLWWVDCWSHGSRLPDVEITVYVQISLYMSVSVSVCDCLYEIPRLQFSDLSNQQGCHRVRHKIPYRIPIAFLVYTTNSFQELMVGKTRDSVIIRCEIRMNKWSYSFNVMSLQITQLANQPLSIKWFEWA
jgi:hypothetical protein